jgi:hypothetical protein
LLKELISDAQPPKGAFDFAGLTVSLKRYPDTKLEFFSDRLSPRSPLSNGTRVGFQSWLV